uniref:Fe2OG dioxygenase domain-containing protein n=1 Tax=Eucampia antarctica TaxID=49252 RepID=A0A7S2R288_9STRA
MSYKDEADGNKIKHFNPNDNFHLKIRNLSQYRVDVYWDDGMYGNLVGTMNVGDDDLQVNTFLNHGFFVTRHGTKDILYEEGEEEQERIRLIASHPNQILEIALDVGPSNDPCRDRFTMCPTEAKKGSCLTAPGWMIVHCCESCQSDLNSRELIDVNKRCSREHLNVTEPIWKPGDLNKLFEHWATDPSFAPYEPKVWSSPDPQKYGGADGPWIVTFDNFITDLEVADVIHGGHISGFERSTDQGAVAKNTGEQEKVVSKTRTSSNAWCRGECERLPGVKSLTAKIERFTQVPHRHFESYQILDYEPNQFYRSHHDSARRDLTMSGPRIMTFFLYLSDVEEGGETRFTSLNISVKPKKGRALIWPSVTDDDPGYWDDRTYHEAKAVIKGKKYAANHWIHLYDFVTPNEWGCTGGFA